MKRILILSLMLILSLSAAAEEQYGWYLQTAKELTSQVGELAADDAYLEIMGAPDLSCAEDFRQADFDAPISAWYYTVPPIKGMLALMGGVSSDTALEYLESQIPSSAITMYNGKFSADRLAAATVLSYSRSFLLPDGFEPCIVALELDRGAVAVAFAQSGDGIITATAQPLLTDETLSPRDAATGLNSTFPLRAPIELEL